MTTDGISVSLAFDRKMSTSDKAKTPSSTKHIFAKEDLTNITQSVIGPNMANLPVIGVDPGMKNLLYCSGDGKIGYRYSAAERRKNTRYTKNVKEEKSVRDMSDVTNAIKEMSQFDRNVPTEEGFMSYLHTRWKETPILSAWYQQDCHRSDSLSGYSRKQREDDRLRKVLLDKLGEKGSMQTKKTFERNVVIAYGSWGEDYSGGLKGSPSTPNKHLLKIIQSCFEHVVIVNERYTSQTCHHCGFKALPVNVFINDNKTPEKRRGLLRCTNEDCRRFLSRDNNAAINIKKLGENMIRQPNDPDKHKLKKPQEGTLADKLNAICHTVRPRIAQKSSASF